MLVPLDCASFVRNESHEEMLSIWQRINDFRSSTFFITAVVCYAIFVDQLFFAFILPVLPYSLPNRNGVAEDRAQYWTTILIVVFGVACFLACRWWTDRHASRRIPFIVGLLILLASTLLMWLATPMALQVLSRVGQGAADAMLYIVGMTIILDTVSVKHIAEYMGHVAIAMNVGTFAGPLLGGVVFARAGYHAMWWMMLGFVILDGLLRFVMVEKTKVSRAEDVARQSESDLEQELTRDINSQDIDVSEVKTAPSTDGMQSVRISTYKAADQSLPSDGTERRHRLPAIVTLLASMRMDVALYGVCVQAMIFSGFETVVSLYVQEIWDYSSLGAGLIFVPLTIPAFFAPILGRIVDRTSPRWVLVTGFLGLCPVLVAIQYVKHNSIRQKVLMCALLVMVGSGITMALNPLMAEISYVVDDLEKREPRRYRRKTSHGGGAYAQAYALFAMAWSVGNIAGPLLCGLIKDEAGWASMCIALATVSGTTALPCFIWSGEGLQGWPFKSNK